MTARRRAPVGRIGVREAIWAVLRLQPRGDWLTVRKVAELAGAGAEPTRSYLAALTSAGVLAVRRAEGPGKPAFYRLQRDLGVEAPRAGQGGALAGAATSHERIWQAIKALGAFGRGEVMVATELSAERVLHYLRWLERAGYLQVVGRLGRQRRWRLLPARNSGPRPPALCRQRGRLVVYDHNLGRQMFPAEAIP